MQTTFRALLKDLDARRVLRHVSRAVDPKHQLVAVMRKVQKTSNEPLLFDTVTGSPAAVAANIFCRRTILADALGLETRSLVPSLVAMEGKTQAPETVTDAPVQEIVKTADFDIARDIPQIVHCERDGGAYISAGICIARHPDTGEYNASWNRIQVVGGDHTRIRMMPPQHLGQYQEVAEQRGERMPVAVAIGAPPALMLSAASKIPIEADELAVAGAWQGQPLRVVPAKTVPLMVPADAEFIIEGEVVPGAREIEGPFGEFTDAYAEAAPNHVMRVTAITRRKDAIYHIILAGGPEDSVLLGVPLQTEVYKRVSAFARIRDIATPGHIFGCVVSIEKTSDDQAKAVMLAAMAAHPWMKIVIVVDADVDPHDPTEVLWAIHTRNTPETGIMMIPHLGSFQRADVRAAHRGKVAIDATAPMAMKDVFKRRQFPGINELDLNDFLDPLPGRTA
ncbi:UbiD family decarboxylase [Microbacteriaceae bacterium K1510]|nr:UbiD family decarboxylase [Microbacteriaceae bacterium K1510]